MSAKRSDKLALDCVPDLQITGMSANAKKCAVTGPLDACYAIVRADVIKFGYFAWHGRPEVDTGAEADGECVLRGPVD